MCHGKHVCICNIIVYYSVNHYHTFVLPEGSTTDFCSTSVYQRTHQCFHETFWFNAQHEYFIFVYCKTPVALPSEAQMAAHELPAGPTHTVFNIEWFNNMNRLNQNIQQAKFYLRSCLIDCSGVELQLLFGPLLDWLSGTSRDPFRTVSCARDVSQLVHMQSV